MHDLPTKFQQRLGCRRHSMIRPGEKVELSDGAGLVCAEILQVEASHQIILTPDMLGHQMHLQLIFIYLFFLFQYLRQKKSSYARLKASKEIRFSGSKCSLHNLNVLQKYAFPFILIFFNYFQIPIPERCRSTHRLG